MARISRALAIVAALCASAPTSAGETAAPDPRITSTARLLAGIAPDYPPLAGVAATDAWQTHRKELAPRWAQLQRQRLRVIEKWRDEVLRTDVDNCRTLLYPFSGPDFLNAYLWFPRCDTYVLFGLEPPGEVPALEDMSPEDATALLEDVRASLRDILARNYFITKHMSEQLRTPRLTGVLPLVLMTMGLNNLSVTAVEPFDLAQLPGPHPVADGRDRRRAKAVKLTFHRPPSGKPQTMYYLSLDVTDAALRANPEFLPFIQQFKPSVTLIKSASYLLHAREFAGTRRALLDASALIVQDDTGVPYRYLRKADFEVRLYGRYVPPIRDFPWAYQRDIAAAYEEAEDVPALPFAFGYHWKVGESSLIVARRRATRP